jgi:hypothetical protein
MGVLAMLLFALVLSATAQGSKIVYDTFGNPTTTNPTGNALDGGLFNAPRGIAVNTAGAGGAGAGNVYVVNSTGNRIDQFTAKGQFIRAFGRDVIEEGKPNNNGTGFEICDTTAGNAAADCKAGATTPQEGGTLSAPQGIAIDQATGNVYVSNQGLLRVDEFDATGHFIRAFGQDVVSAGPDNVTATSAKQTLTVDATEGQFKLNFRGQTTANLAYNATATEVATALTALSQVGKNGVTVTGGPGGAGGGTPYVITFGGSLAKAPMQLITTSPGTTPLGGGAGASVVNTTIGSTGYEVCNAPADTCKIGVTGSTAGAFATTFSGHLAVAPPGAPNAGNVIVADPGNRRVQEFTSSGVFVRAFGQDVVSNGVDNSLINEQQTVTITANGGTFTLSFNPGAGSQTTGAINYNASPAEVETALNALSNMVAVGATVSVSGGPGNATGSTPYTITFGGTLAGDDVTAMTASATNLTLSTGTKSAVVATSTQGGAFEICKAASFDVCQVGGTSGSGVGQFGTNGPNRVAVDSTGSIYTLEQASPNFRLQKFTASGGNLMPALFNPPIGVAPTVFLSGTAAADAPSDVAVGAGDHVFVTKACNPASNCPNAGTATERRIYEFDSSGNLVDTDLTGAGMPATNGLVVNGMTGTLYVDTSQSGTPQGVYIVTDPPASAPVATTGANVEGAGFALRTLEGTVNPSGFKLKDCRFAYGTTSEYGKTTPCIPGPGAIGEGTGDVAVSASTEPLEPNTTYHYRLLASNVARSSQGKDWTFTTGEAPPDNCPNAAIRAEQGIVALQLPDCMALEQVSPVVKHNQHARLPSVSANGERVLFNSQATIGDHPESKWPFR